MFCRICGIDGYFGGQPVSITPDTAGRTSSLLEEIDVPIVYYEENDTNEGQRLHAEASDEPLHA